MKHSQLKQLVKEELKKAIDENERERPYKGLSHETAREVLNALRNQNYGRDEDEIREKLQQKYGETIPKSQILFFVDRLIKYYKSFYDEMKSQGVGLPDLYYYVANSIRRDDKTKSLPIGENVDSHEEMGNEHRKLKKQLELAKQYMEKKRRLHKADPTNDQARFQFQDAISLVDKLEKKLWSY